MRIHPKLKLAVAAGLICLLSFAVGMLTAGSGRQLLSRVTSLAGSVQKRISILLAGEDKFIHDELEKSYRKPVNSVPDSTRMLDTSRLPLTLKFVPLGNQPQFAASPDLVRGSLTIVENKIFAMDKLGNIFKFENGLLRKMQYGIFPSGIERSILNTINSVPPNSIRALYIAYDKSRNTIFVSQQRYNADSKHVRFNVSAITIDGTTLERRGEWRTIFETEDIPNSSSFRGATGGKLIVGVDTLYFTVGDYNFGQVPENESALVAQNERSSFGKIYEHNLKSGKTTVKSIGHRNPQGLVLTKSGLLIDAEHGPEGGDELNIITNGSNYGWPYKTYGTDYGTFNWPIKFRPKGGTFTEPMYTWVPSAAVSTVIEVSDFSDRWNGDLLVGSLKARTLFRLRIADNRVLFSEPIWVGHRIRDIAQIDNQIVLMTDDPGLIFITIDEQRLKANSKLQKDVEFNPVLATCLNCHHFGETNPSHLAPTLANVIGKRIASDSFERYSDALKKKGGAWDEASLAKFIRDPNDFAAGSAMPNLGLSQQQVRDVVNALGRRKPK